MTYPLRSLKTRDPNDFAIALLDAWATVADVLAFYQERIANEGYLRTATERCSVLELARLIGYELRPGVASTVYLAYTLNEDKSVMPPKPTATTIPKDSRVQSVPSPGELPQSFETSNELEARSQWNNLQVRLTQPQTITEKNATNIETIYFQGISVNLKVNNPLLIIFGNQPHEQFLRRVVSAKSEPEFNRTKVKLQGGLTDNQAAKFDATGLDDLLESLRVVPALQRGSAFQLSRSASEVFEKRADASPRLLATLNPTFKETLYRAWASATATGPSSLRAAGPLRVSAKPFGHNAPPQLAPLEEPKDAFKISAEPKLRNTWNGLIERLRTNGDVIALDSEYDQIKTGSWIVVTKPIVAKSEQIKTVSVSFHQVKAVESLSLDAFGLAARVTVLTLETPWLLEKEDGMSRDQALSSTLLLRGTSVYAQFEELTLAEEPIEECVGHHEQDAERGRRIELRDLVDGLDSGRWLIVSGERADVKDANGIQIAGVNANELALLANVEQTYIDKLPDERTHSTLILDRGLTYCYKRETVKIYGNVVKATHGETRNETLGGGDASKAMQQFTLKQPPLTFVSAPNPSGVDSTLVVRVNDVQWHETGNLAGSLPTDRNFMARTDDEGKTTVIFGSGKYGARLPTGQENVKAVYRNGIGKPGNVKAGQISLLVTQPLHVKEVINPLPATGGADKENRDQARDNAPLAVMALDRLVSTQDYADFARQFAGIGKASAARLSDGRRQLVHVTIAGAEDIPIALTSDLYWNLIKALRDFGDPYLPLEVELRKLMLLIVQAKVRVLPDYLWEKVEPKVRTAVLEKFSFARCDLGQDALLSEAISAIQTVEGVQFVDVDKFDGVDEQQVVDALAEKMSLAAQIALRPRVLVGVAQVDSMETDPSKRIKPAELAYFSPDVPDTIILSEITR